jgi:DNA-binding beta-propeller fold protein YncE
VAPTAGHGQPADRTADFTGPPGWGAGTAGQPAVRRRRSPVALLAAVVVALALVGGGAYYLVAGRGQSTGTSNGGGGGGGQSQGGGGTSAPIPFPGCSSDVGQAQVHPVSENKVRVPDNPFGVQPSNDGRFVFATLPDSLVVLSKGSGLSLTTTGARYGIAGNPKNMALTKDGRHLLVAACNGITVLSTAAAEAGQAGAIIATMSTGGVPQGHGGAISIALSKDEKFAFVVLQYRHAMSVFNLQHALHPGTGAVFVGTVPLQLNPVGLAASPDGQWLYAANSNINASSSTGSISVINVHAAETNPGKNAVMRTVRAGCQTARVMFSNGGRVLWVTAKASNILMAVDPVLLRTDPRRALLATVRVGATPIGMALLNDRRVIVADTNVGGQLPAGNNLAVVDATRALHRKPNALLAYIPSGEMPRQLALVPGSTALLVSDNGSAEIHVLATTDLP